MVCVVCMGCYQSRGIELLEGAMRETLFALCLLVLTAGAYGRPSPTLLNNGELVQHSRFKGRPKWNLIPYLWTDKKCEHHLRVYQGAAVPS